jgi:ribA/ribD-fused uncharacterized protein
MSDPILGFNSEWHPFSNFHREPDGTCVEIEFQAQKTMLPSERSRILTAGSPGKAKRCGKDKSLTTLRPDWEDIKIDRMHMLVETKFCTWKELAALLLSSGDRELVETNNWGDDFWGREHAGPDLDVHPQGHQSSSRTGASQESCDDPVIPWCIVYVFFGWLRRRCGPLLVGSRYGR